MLTQLMRLQVNLGRENDKLLLQASRFPTDEVILREMSKQRIVVEKVLRCSSIGLTADMTLLVTISAMNIQLIITIESRATE